MPKVSPGFDVLREVFISPNELDRNLESANVVDGLFAIARALGRCAKAIEDMPVCTENAAMRALLQQCYEQVEDNHLLDLLEPFVNGAAGEDATKIAERARKRKES